MVNKVDWNPGKVELVRHLYWDEQKSPQEIVAILSLPIKPSTIVHVLHKHNIPSRSLQEATKLARKKFRSNYLIGIAKRTQKHTDWTAQLVQKVYNMYYKQNMSAKEISKVVNVKPYTILTALKRHGYNLRTNSESQKLVHAKHPELYCMAASPSWKGGRRINKYGYVMVLLSKNDPYYPMAQKSGHIGEHRLIMAQHLGRCLEKWEIVHHRNGNKSDNRIKNLKLLPSPYEHRPYTLVTTKVVQRIKMLEKRVTMLEAENELLRSQNQEGVVFV